MKLQHKETLTVNITVILQKCTLLTFILVIGLKKNKRNKHICRLTVKVTYFNPYLCFL